MRSGEPVYDWESSVLRELLPLMYPRDRNHAARMRSLRRAPAPRTTLDSMHCHGAFNEDTVLLVRNIRVALPIPVAILLASANAEAQRDGGAPPAGTKVNKTLRVVAAGNAPFVFEDKAAPRGISVEIWKQVANRLGRKYELEHARTVPEALERVTRGEADVAVGPISITAERAEHVAFTQPYFDSALAILAPPGGRSLWSRIRPFLSNAFLGGAASLLLVLLVVGLLLWWVERKHNAMFPDGKIQGAGVGLWLAIVTMTTVGYGDKVPVTTGGRIVASIWMLISMLTVSSLTAFLATAFTVASLDYGTVANAQDLPGRKVAGVEGTTGTAFARRHGAKIVGVDNLAEAVERIRSGKAEAVVYDRPMLRYHLEQNEGLELILSEATYEPQDYGFAVQRQTDLAERLDVVLLTLQESGRIDRIVARWLGAR